MYYVGTSKLKVASMRKLMVLGGLCLLSACASMPMESSMQSSFNGQRFESGPTNIHDSRFGSPSFYSESDDMRLPSFE